MKAVILVAGFGSRLKPLTNETPKSLLPIGQTTTLTRMVRSLSQHGISEFIFVTGHFEDKIKDYINTHLSDINASFIRNDKYEKTNTGYSLLLAEPFIGNESFIKLDGDVNFDPEILDRLMRTPDDANYLCLDKSDVDNEVIKAELDTVGKVIALGKYVDIDRAAGESIGIEKISAKYAQQLFTCLKQVMSDESLWQEYYEYAYDLLIKNNQATFKAVDITGLKWVEMDNLKDYELAKTYFGATKV
jgi:choline kinase